MLHFEAGVLSSAVELIEKAKDDEASFVAPRYSSTSIRFITASPLVLLEIKMQLLPTGHIAVQTKVSPNPDEVYPGKQVHGEDPSVDEAPGGHEETELISDTKKDINIKRNIFFMNLKINNYNY